MYEATFDAPLPTGRTGRVRLRVDLEKLAQDLAWKAYYNAKKRTSLKNGIVLVDIVDDGAVPTKKPDPT